MRNIFHIESNQKEASIACRIFARKLDAIGIEYKVLVSELRIIVPAMQEEHVWKSRDFLERQGVSYLSGFIIHEYTGVPPVSFYRYLEQKVEFDNRRFD